MGTNSARFIIHRPQVRGYIHILPNEIKKRKSLYGRSISAYIVPKERAFDIDTHFIEINRIFNA